MDDAQLDTSAVNQIYGMLYALTSILGIVGNVLVFKTIWRERRKSFLHLQLAVANIISLSSIAMSGPSALRGNWLFGTAVCKWFGFQAFLSGFATMTFTSLICIECYIAFCRRSQYKVLSGNVFSVISAGVWICSFFLALAPVLGWNAYVVERGSTSCGIDMWNFNNATHYSYLMITSVVFGIVVVVALACLSLTVISRPGRDSFLFDPLLNDTELVKVSSALMSIMVLGCIPFFIRVMRYLGQNPSLFDSFLSIEFSHLTMKLSNCLQPIAYFIFSGQFRELSQSMVTGYTPEKKHN